MEFFQRHKTVAAILAILTVGILILFTFFGGDEEEQLPLQENMVAKQVVLFFNTGERIDKMMVGVGDHVAKGDVMATLQADALLQSIEDDKEKIKQQEAVIDRLEQNILHDGEQIAQLTTQLKGLRADLLLKERKLRQSIIFAPENGVVYDMLLQPGDIVEPQQPVYYLVVDK